MSYVSRYLDPSLVERLRRLQLSARSVVQGSITGLHRSPVKGASVEFRQHRAYARGDEPRRLDWRLLGRTDRPFVKEYEEETNLRCVLALDCSGSMAYGQKFGTKFDYAAQLVAALAWLMLQQTESVGLALLADQLDVWLKAGATPQQLFRIIDALDRAQVGGGSALARAMHDVADRLERRALVVVVSDFFCPADQLRSGLAHLRHDRHEVIAVQVTDRDEEEFPFGSWRRFRGLEGEEPWLAEPSLLRQTYLDNFRRHRQQLQESCRAMDVELESFVTDRPLADALESYLLRREGRRVPSAAPA